MIFAFLFGLSMDYEVFILARMREEYDRTGDTSMAVITGIGRTGRLVTSAALILFFAFSALATSPGTDVKVLGTALGVGILIDATIVRALLVPALVSLLRPVELVAARLARPRPVRGAVAAPPRRSCPRSAARAGQGARRHQLTPPDRHEATPATTRREHAMITIDELTKKYGGFTRRRQHHLHAETGRVTGFLGPNGAGKSTSCASWSA